jgi:hypothetical protein
MNRAVRCGLVAAVVSSTACQAIVARSCEGPPRRLDYWTALLTDVDRANRIVVQGGNARLDRLATISDSNKVRAAAAFLKRHPDGWRESWNGGGCYIILYFYHDIEVLGDVSLTPTREVDDHGRRTVRVCVGSLFHRVNATEVEALVKEVGIDAEVESVARRLGVQWPPSQQE